MKTLREMMDLIESAQQDVVEGSGENWIKLPNGNYRNTQTGVVASRPPTKKKRGEKTGAEWDAIEKAKKEQGVAEADKHSFVGKIQRGNELKKKVDSTWNDIGDAQKAGDKEAGSKAFRKHERYANLERPGTFTKVDEQGVAEEQVEESTPDALAKIDELFRK